MSLVERFKNRVEKMIDERSTDTSIQNPDYISEESLQGWKGGIGIVRIVSDMDGVESATFHSPNTIEVTREDGEQITLRFNKSNAKISSSSNTNKMNYSESINRFIEGLEDHIHRV